MKKWARCYDCGFTFDENKAEVFVEQETGWRSVLCPHCGGQDLEEMNACKFCGEPTENDDLCDDCRSELVDAFEDTMYRLVSSEVDFDEAREAAKDFLIAAWGN